MIRQSSVRCLTPTSPDGMMPPREGPPMERRGSRLSRRQFMVGAAGLGLVAGCGRLPWPAWQPAIPRIGYLGDHPIPAFNEAFRQGLREHGYVDGQNLTIEWRFAEGSPEALAGLAAS